MALETVSEANSLMAEVGCPQCGRSLHGGRMGFVCDRGGGACFSAGTASAKVVSCDQQLAVSAPCPRPGFWPFTCPPCLPCQTGAVNYYHLAHELGHASDLAHPPGPSGSLAESTPGSNMQPSGFCCDNPNVQSAKNCRNFSNPLFYWGSSVCLGSPDIKDCTSKCPGGAPAPPFGVEVAFPPRGQQNSLKGGFNAGESR